MACLIFRRNKEELRRLLTCGVSEIAVPTFSPLGKVNGKYSFVTNGGFGSVNLSLSNGVPLVVAGDTEDKIFTASRVAWSGTGINLGTGRPTSEQIRTAVHAVLADKKYKENAARLQKAFAQYDAFNLITETVDSLLSSRNSDELLATASARG